MSTGSKVDGIEGRGGSSSGSGSGGGGGGGGGKAIYILTSSGKPIYASSTNGSDSHHSQEGDEELKLVNLFGLIQAMISIVHEEGQDLPRAIHTADKTILFLLRKNIYLLLVTSTREPEGILLQQLEFFYQHLLLVLTQKIHDILEKNPSTDIRQLLGSDSDQILASCCAERLVPRCLAFQTLATGYVEKMMREELTVHMRYSVEHAGAAVGLLLQEEMLLSSYKNPSLDLNLTTSDVILLTYFVSQSKSLRTNDQHWVPLCLPAFNASGYLHVYISTVLPAAPIATTTASPPASTNLLPSTPSSSSSIQLILIAVSNDPEVFGCLRKGRDYLERVIRRPEWINKFSFANITYRTIGTPFPHLLSIFYDLLLCYAMISPVDQLRDEMECLHFFYKFSLLLPKGDSQTAWAQSIHSSPAFPLNYSEAEIERMWIEYQKLSLQLRKGSSAVEATLTCGSSSDTNLNTSSPNNSAKIAFGLGGSNSSANGLIGGGRVLRESTIFPPPAPSSSSSSSTTSYIKTATSEAHAFDSTLQIASSMPHVDHSLAYSITLSGLVCVALATYDTEVFFTFPAHISPLEACSRAEASSRRLKTLMPNFSSQII